MTGAGASAGASPADFSLADGRALRPARPRRELGAAALFLLGLTLLVLGPELFAPDDRVLSNGSADLELQFVHWRAFGFGEMRAGHLPLWNPHIFCGAPFFGGFQSALLYPPNWLYLILPLARAINAGIALHVFLAGFCMYLWARERPLHPLACAFAAVLFMFSGPYFAHIDAGHLPNLCAMVWGPLIFLAIDRWLERRTLGAILLGGGGLALQILAGHPQYVFYTGIAAGFYCVLGLPCVRRPWHAAAGLGLIGVLGVSLSAVQLLEGLHAAGESLRSRGVGYEFAALFSFPPENFLTSIAPEFFGGVAENAYWGRWTFCETSLFFGVTGLVFAIYGACGAGRRGRGNNLRLLIVAGVLLVLALGAYTPLLSWLFWHVPGFNKFRGLSKFIYPAVLFLILLAAAGFDSLLAGGAAGVGLIAGTAGAAVVLGITALALLPASEAAAGAGLVAGWMRSLYTTREVLFPPELLDQPAFLANAARSAAHGLFFAAGTLLALSLVLCFARRLPAAARLLVLGLACAEMVLFAESTLETFSLADAQTSAASVYLTEHPAPPGSRILDFEDPNLAMSIGARDIWGYDPGVVRRYAEFIAASQGIDPDRVNEELPFTRQPPLYGSLLGCRYVFPKEFPEAGSQPPVFTFPLASLAPRLSLVSQVRVVRGRAAIFDALANPAFDPRQSVILESPPQIAPVSGPGPAGAATLLAETSDSLTIDAELTRPAILVVADTYCSGWTVRPLPFAGGNGSPQTTYQIVPADYCLRAIPLPAGHHRLLLAYRPMAFVVGAWISIVALAVYLLSCAALWRGWLFPRGAG